MYAERADWSEWGVDQSVYYRTPTDLVVDDDFTHRNGVFVQLGIRVDIVHRHGVGVGLVVVNSLI